LRGGKGGYPAMGGMEKTAREAEFLFRGLLER